MTAGNSGIAALGKPVLFIFKNNTPTKSHDARRWQKTILKKSKSIYLKVKIDGTDTKR